jgi:predicted transcriptional regulator
MRIKIVEDWEKNSKETDNYVKRVMSGKEKIDKKRVEKTIIVTPEIFTKIFSAQRLSLMLKIKKNKAKNIYQLAKELDRKYEAVYRDIKLLEGYGIIYLVRKDNKQIPLIDGPITIPELAQA